MPPKRFLAARHTLCVPYTYPSSLSLHVPCTLSVKHAIREESFDRLSKEHERVHPSPHISGFVVSCTCMSPGWHLSLSFARFEEIAVKQYCGLSVCPSLSLSLTLFWCIAGSPISIILVFVIKFIMHWGMCKRRSWTDGWMDCKMFPPSPSVSPSVLYQAVGRRLSWCTCICSGDMSKCRNITSVM